MQLSEIFTLMSIEANENPEWKWDENTTTLLIVQNNLNSLLKAVMFISDECKNLENIDVHGLVMGLVQTLEWICDNTKMVEREVSDGNG